MLQGSQLSQIQVIGEETRGRVNTEDIFIATFSEKSNNNCKLYLSEITMYFLEFTVIRSVFEAAVQMVSNLVICCHGKPPKKENGMERTQPFCEILHTLLL